MMLRIIAMGLESCDGPNQYYSHNVELATYSQLLTQPQYFQLYIVCMSFLICDTVLKTLLLALITLEEENYVLYYKMQKDKLWLQLLSKCTYMCVYVFC
ncbi:hypothetical protein EON65_54115 [archaeon]|nr:MAG: hypothetical protein EON65_54115 [archaeon]